MSKKYNATYRVYKVLTLAVSQNSTGSALQAWERVFDLMSIKDSNERASVVGEMVSLLYKEVKLVHQEAKASSLSPETYEDAFQSIYQALDIGSLNSSWQQYAKYLDRMSLRVIQILSEHSNQVEGEIEESIIKQLLQEVEDLYAEVLKVNYHRTLNRS